MSGYEQIEHEEPMIASPGWCSPPDFLVDPYPRETVPIDYASPVIHVHRGWLRRWFKGEEE